MSAMTMERPTEPPRFVGLDPAFEAMHRDLVDYGACFLRGGGAVVDAARDDIVRTNNLLGAEAKWERTTTPYREADPRFNRRDWLQTEIEAAGLLHNRIIALGAPRSLVLQVYYFEEDAATLHQLSQVKLARRILDLTVWRGKPLGVNPRIERHNRETSDNVPLIVPEAFMAIRHRAIRELCARERGMPR